MNTPEKAAAIPAPAIRNKVILFILGLTLVYGMTFLGIAGLLRTNANQPQIDLAGVAVADITSGSPVFSVIPQTVVDFSQSLEPFMIIYDGTGSPLTGNGSMNGQVPSPSLEVLQKSSAHGESQITWQPRNGVRIAAVIRPIAGSISGYILTGRSLQEVEQKTDRLLIITLCAYAGTLLLAFIPLYIFRERYKPKT